MYRKFNKTLLICLVMFLFIIALINIIIDPYFQYHYPLFGMQPVVDDDRYQNPGIAKHFDYDSILIGSSMTQNFRVSEIDEIFDTKTVKLSYSAIRSGSFDAMFDIAFSTHDVKQVIMGIDLDPLLVTPGTYMFPIPEYLYDTNYLNDVNYVLNKSVLLKASSKSVMHNLYGNVPNIDEAYSWWQTATFSKEQAMSSVYWDMYQIGDPVEKPSYIENAKINLDENIISHIKANPETQFYIFYPPYNLLWWNLHRSEGDLDAILNLLDYTTTQLLACENVQLYGLQNVMPLVSDLDNYMDYNHYSPQVNSMILSWIKNGEYQLSEENAKQYVQDVKTLVETFDYTSFE